MFIIFQLVTLASAPVPVETDMVAMLDKCRAIANQADRLACFDQAAMTIKAMVTSKSVVVIDREALVKERRRQFGMAKADDPAYRAANIAQPALQNGKIISVKSIGYFYRIEVDGIGVWQTTEDSFRTPQVNEEVTIRKGALGSFIMTFGQSSTRVKRVQ